MGVRFGVMDDTQFVSAMSESPIAMIITNESMGVLCISVSLLNGSKKGSTGITDGLVSQWSLCFKSLIVVDRKQNISNPGPHLSVRNLFQ